MKALPVCSSYEFTSRVLVISNTKKGMTVSVVIHPFKLCASPLKKRLLIYYRGSGKNNKKDGVELHLVLMSYCNLFLDLKGFSITIDFFLNRQASHLLTNLSQTNICEAIRHEAK